MDQIQFTKEEIEEFITEATEMLSQAEDSFLSLDKGTEFKSCYQNIFRVFHSIKGGSGMFGLNKIYQHMHEVENIFQAFKDKNSMTPDHVSYFLSAIDACRKMIKGEEVQFTYSLPDKKNEPSQRPEKGNNVTQITAPAKNRDVIFAIDDQEPILEIVRTRLSDHFKVLTYTDPQKAISEVSLHKPCAIIADYNMPQMTGLEAHSQIHQIDPDVPVILMSGVLTKDVVLQAINLGIHGVIEKDATEIQMLTLVESAAAKYKLSKLLTKSINLILYQLPELSNYLRMKGQSDTQKLIETAFNELLETRRSLKKIQAA